MEKEKERIIRSRVDAEHAGERLDLYLSRRFTYLSRTQWQSAVKKGIIRLNGTAGKGANRVRAGDLIEFKPDHNEPEVDRNYSVLFEDEYILALNKSGSLPCHPAGPYFNNTLWGLLREEGRRTDNIHFINRLDRETSGIILLAKESSTAAQFAEKSDSLILTKRYMAGVYGEFSEELSAEGYLVVNSDTDSDYPDKVRKKRIYMKDKPECAYETCHTIFRPLKTGISTPGKNPNNCLSLVEAELFTGRTHQIRATLSSLGYPLVGDKLYGPDESLFLRFISDSMSQHDRDSLILSRQALHASECVFKHPYTGEDIKITASLPNDMRGVFG